MHPVVHRLHRDHHHLDQALDLLEQHVDAFHDGAQIDFELISDPQTGATVFFDGFTIAPAP